MRRRVAVGSRGMRSTAARRGFGLRLAGLCAVLGWLVAGCGSGALTAVTSASSSEAAPPSSPATTPVTTLASLPPELVGSWTTATWQSQSGYPQLRRTYVFAADGRYAYTLGQCESSTQCALVSRESGAAHVANGVLYLQPQTDSSDGPRSSRYVVDRDPVVGDVRLNLSLASGDTDIFYRE
ncbi:MAG: hypothetical protein HY829_01230 [Actinobacteria bacterium]|nr:hypothetical protein [Actinomycetota bacterium]